MICPPDMPRRPPQRRRGRYIHPFAIVQFEAAGGSSQREYSSSRKSTWNSDFSHLSVGLLLAMAGEVERPAELHVDKDVETHQADQEAEEEIPPEPPEPGEKEGPSVYGAFKNGPFR